MTTISTTPRPLAVRRPAPAAPMKAQAPVAPAKPKPVVAPAQVGNAGAWTGGILGGVFGAAGGAAGGGAIVGILSVGSYIGGPASAILVGAGALIVGYLGAKGGAEMGRSAETALKGDFTLRAPKLREVVGGTLGGALGAGAGFMTGFVGSVLGAPDFVITALMRVGPFIGGALGMAGGAAAANKLAGK